MAYTHLLLLGLKDDAWLELVLVDKPKQVRDALLEAGRAEHAAL